jgi:hypothetical protein
MRIKPILGGVLGGLMMAQSASALSCARPDLVRTLEAAKASPKIYYVLVGTFTSLSSGPAFTPWEGLSPQDQMKQRPPLIIPSHFEGYSLAKNDRHDVSLKRFPVDIEVSCVASWCSDVPPPDRELIAFVEARDSQAPILRISPCPSQTFAADQTRVLKARQCLDRRCSSDMR